jgi:NitT/TauT family transport system substrate-binding protein
MSDSLDAIGSVSLWHRRRLLQAAALLPAGLLLGCGPQPEPTLRVASNVWPGYEFLYAARDSGLLDGAAVKLVELLSATDVLQALSADALEGGALTLDEVLSARAGGIDLRVVAVLDISAGADALLARPDIEKLVDLRGRRIALEQTAVGALLLDAALREAGLEPADVRLLYRTSDQLRAAYEGGEADAVVTFEPVRSQLLATGARSLFDSRAIHGRIVDVLAMRPRALEQSPRAVRALVAGHFEMVARFRREPDTLAPQLAGRLGMSASEAVAAYTGLELPDVAGNRALLEGRSPVLEQSAAELGRVMLQARLLPMMPSLDGLADARWLPASGAI